MDADTHSIGFHVAVLRIVARRLRIFTSRTMKDLCNEWIAMVQRLASFSFELQFAETAEQGKAIGRLLASIP